MTMSAENRSKFAALHRQWWCLHMSDILSSGTINSNKQNKKSKVKVKLRVFEKISAQYLLTPLLESCQTWYREWGNAPAEYKDPIDVWVTWSKVKVKLLKKCCLFYIFWRLCLRMNIYFSFLIAYGYLLSAASICTFLESWNRKPYDWENV